MGNEELKTYVISFDGNTEALQDIIKRVCCEYGIELELVGGISDDIVEAWVYNDIVTD